VAPTSDSLIDRTIAPISSNIGKSSLVIPKNKFAKNLQQFKTIPNNEEDINTYYE